MVRILINYAKCVRDCDGLCVEICPMLIFQGNKSGKPTVRNEENCILCATCQVNCPAQAIEISTS